MVDRDKEIRDEEIARFRARREALTGFIEPQALLEKDIHTMCVLSIAISLKRLADRDVRPM